MPGVNSDSFGFSREVGKMASLDPDLEALLNFNDLREFLSPTTSSSSSPSHDYFESEGEFLPDNEATMGLSDYMDMDVDFGIKSECLPFDLSCQINDGECSPTQDRVKQFKTFRADPFMGLGDSKGRTLSPDRSGPQEDHAVCYNESQITDSFSAWGHKPAVDEDEHLMLTNSYLYPSLDENEEASLPDTPSSYSSTITGDDSDVDIETVTDLPRTADRCGYSTQDSSPAATPPRPTTPLRTMVSILQTSCLSAKNASSKPVAHYSCGVSSSVSLAENLLSGRPGLAGQKRKLQKDRKHVSKSNSNGVSATSFLTSGNCVNFHDYAMSPVPCLSTDTAQPTVLPKQRMYKRRQMSSLDQEKQHHHNQLERNRRQKLADLFIDLRDEIPSIANQAKASKVMILNHATSYIEDLHRIEENQQQQISSECRRRDTLRRQLRQLGACS